MSDIVVVFSYYRVTIQVCFGAGRGYLAPLKSNDPEATMHGMVHEVERHVLDNVIHPMQAGSCDLVTGVAFVEDENGDDSKQVEVYLDAIDLQRQADVS